MQKQKSHEPTKQVTTAKVLLLAILAAILIFRFVWYATTAKEIARKIRRIEANQCFEVVNTGEYYEAVLIQSDHCVKMFRN